jgi:hypothetical protein
VLDGDRELLARPATRLLEPTVPRLEARAVGGHVAAHRETTGQELTPVPRRVRAPARVSEAWSAIRVEPVVVSVTTRQPCEEPCASERIRATRARVEEDARGVRA